MHSLSDVIGELEIIHEAKIKAIKNRLLFNLVKYCDFLVICDLWLIKCIAGNCRCILEDFVIHEIKEIMHHNWLESTLIVFRFISFALWLSSRLLISPKHQLLEVSLKLCNSFGGFLGTLVIFSEVYSKSFEIDSISSIHLLLLRLKLHWNISTLIKQIQIIEWIWIIIAILTSADMVKMKFLPRLLPKR